MFSPTCKICGEGFRTTLDNQIYCSYKCRKRAKSVRQRRDRIMNPRPESAIQSSLKNGSPTDKMETLKLIDQSTIQGWPTVNLPAFDIQLVQAVLDLAKNPLIDARIQLKAIDTYSKLLSVADKQVRTNLEIEKLRLFQEIKLPVKEMEGEITYDIYSEETPTTNEMGRTDNPETPGTIQISPTPGIHSQRDSQTDGGQG